MAKREKFGYAESSALAATYGDGHIYSVVDNDKVLENGMLVELDELTTNEIYSIKTPEAGSKVVLVLDPAMDYEHTTKGSQLETYYSIPAGTAARAYGLIENDRFAIVDYMVTTLAGTGKPAVKGNYLVANTNRKYTEVAVADDVSTYGFVAKIVNIEYKSGLTLYRLRVLKNDKIA